MIASPKTVLKVDAMSDDVSPSFQQAKEKNGIKEPMKRTPEKLTGPVTLTIVREVDVKVKIISQVIDGVGMNHGCKVVQKTRRTERPAMGPGKPVVVESQTQKRWTKIQAFDASEEDLRGMLYREQREDGEGDEEGEKEEGEDGKEGEEFGCSLEERIDAEIQDEIDNALAEELDLEGELDDEVNFDADEMVQISSAEGGEANDASPGSQQENIQAASSEATVADNHVDTITPSVSPLLVERQEMQKTLVDADVPTRLTVNTETQTEEICEPFTILKDSAAGYEIPEYDTSLNDKVKVLEKTVAAHIAAFEKARKFVEIQLKACNDNFLWMHEEARQVKFAVQENRVNIVQDRKNTTTVLQDLISDKEWKDFYLDNIRMYIYENSNRKCDIYADFRPAQIPVEDDSSDDEDSSNEQQFQTSGAFNMRQQAPMDDSSEGGMEGWQPRQTQAGSSPFAKGDERQFYTAPFDVDGSSTAVVPFLRVANAFVQRDTNAPTVSLSETSADFFPDSSTCSTSSNTASTNSMRQHKLSDEKISLMAQKEAKPEKSIFSPQNLETSLFGYLLQESGTEEASSPCASEDTDDHRDNVDPTKGIKMSLLSKDKPRQSSTNRSACASSWRNRNFFADLLDNAKTQDPPSPSSSNSTNISQNSLVPVTQTPVTPQQKSDEISVDSDKAPAASTTTRTTTRNLNRKSWKTARDDNLTTSTYNTLTTEFIGKTTTLGSDFFSFLLQPPPSDIPAHISSSCISTPSTISSPPTPFFMDLTSLNLFLCSDISQRPIRGPMPQVPKRPRSSHPHFMHPKQSDRYKPFPSRSRVPAWMC